MLRGGYLPYPYVIAMIPFAALTVAGVADWLFAGRLVVVPRIRGPLDVRAAGRPGRPDRAAGPAGPGRRGALVLAVVVAHAWQYGLQDLRHHNRDAGKAAALHWVLDNVGQGRVPGRRRRVLGRPRRAGYPRYARHLVHQARRRQRREAARLPAVGGIDYVLLDHQDDLSVHLQADGQPSKDTLDLFPTLGKALQHSRPVATFGTGLDTVTVRAVDPGTARRPSIPARRPPTPAGRPPTPAGRPPTPARRPPPLVGRPSPPARA